MSFQIAVDGPAGAGKSTIAKEVAKRLNLTYIDTGAMYRAVTLKALRLGIDLNDENQYHFLENTKFDFLNHHLYLDGDDVENEIRSAIVTENVSLPSKFMYVRNKLVSLQQQLALDKDVIMDGRDIGTVVLKNANLKIFLNASVEERARRRLSENLCKGTDTLDLNDTIKAIMARDQKDSTREISPLKKADDAIEIDSSSLCIEDVVQSIISLVMERGYKMEKENLNNEVTEEVVSNNEETVETVEEDTVVTEETAEPVESAETAEAVEEPKSEYKLFQTIKGKVLSVLDSSPAKGKIKAKDQRVLVELPNGQHATLLKNDIADLEENEDLYDRYVEGDEIEAAIKKIFEDGGILLSTKILKLRDELKQFEAVIENHGVFTAKVTKAVNAGLLLDYNGFACLLPSSQVNCAPEEIETLVGQDLDVAPIRVDYNRTRLIVSAKVAAAIKVRQEKNDFVNGLSVGQVFEGTVKNIENYGAFVEIGNGVEGLLHVSELDHNRVVNVSKILNVGDTVKVQIIKLEDGHIGLSRKALIPNFWMNYISDKEVGSVVSGKVVEINNAGLVVELGENVSGFLPKSEFAWERDVFVEDFIKVGDEVSLKIIELDPNKKRIILSRKQMSENPWETLDVKVGDGVTVTVVAILKDGVKVSLNGAIGYASKSNLPEVDFDNLTIGSTLDVKVRVLDVEKTKLLVGNRPAREERQPRFDKESSYNRFMKSEKVSNTLGDIFGDQLKNRK